MMAHNLSIKGPREKGATLIVSLIILAVITLLGVASMRSSNLQLKMAASARDRAVAFQAAETALAMVEQRIEQANYTLNDFMPTCDGNKCFKSTCPNGLCFTGDLVGAQTKSDCKLAAPDGTAKTASWRSAEHWDNNAQKVSVLSNPIQTNGSYVPVDVDYLIEFMCFVPEDENAAADENALNDGVPLYRITARAKGDAGRAEVMLQSVYKGAN